MKDNASPFSFFGKPFNGSDLYDVSDLPGIDAVIITHDHYDHLSYNTICKLRSKCKRFIVPLGVREHLETWGIDPANIIELDWWQQEMITKDISIIATPARHFSGRTFIRNKTLWCSYVLIIHGLRIYLGGDSGYGSHFKTIGERFGPFDLGILECGQYGKGWPQIHMLPEETIIAARDLETRTFMPVHWGKYVLSVHPWNKSVKRAYIAARDAGQNITVPRIGEYFEIGSPDLKDEWWNLD